jgi:hypothetical protein
VTAPAGAAAADAPGGLAGGRSLGTVLRALGGPQHYRALANMLRRYPRPADALARYLFGRGAYPARVAVRTPAGVVQAAAAHAARHAHAQRGVLPPRLRARRARARGGGRWVEHRAQRALLPHPAVAPVLLPVRTDPRNTARLRDNVARFADRWELAEAAVAARPGRVRFATEPTGRYGRVGGDPAPRRSRSTAWGSTTCSSGRSRAPGPSTS